jgi:hypothetical protein
VTKIANLWNEFGVGLGKATDKEGFFLQLKMAKRVFKKYESGRNKNTCKS